MNQCLYVDSVAGMVVGAALLFVGVIAYSVIGLDALRRRKIEQLRTLLYIARHFVADTLTRLERSTHASYPEIEYQRYFLARINSALAVKGE